ncbi:hypothetical protein [Catalinimonas niigatensis]|uniref:hypothetical protein n=1 Tax=Catalinimonas niigatensis TaxID=1397264 RepID=UPI002666AC84|nr:hypothetical protein [Catalinimonas niigatensis]WPP51431.1 hypothetical protein PZB72_03395 [Catalinimonas niigatensis]
MEEEKIDKLSHEMFVHRRMEIPNPDFTSGVMQAIEQVNYAKARRRLFLSWLLAVLVAELSIALLLWSFGVTLGDLTELPDLLLHATKQVFDWMMVHHYLIIPLAIVLILKRIIESKLKYS